MDIIEEFTQLVWDYYGPNGIYAHCFDFELTIDQVEYSVILVYDYFRNHDIEFGEGSYERGVVLDVIIQLYVYDGNSPNTMEYFLELDPYAEFINDIVKWAY